jgi:hypothetical protein
MTSNIVVSLNKVRDLEAAKNAQSRNLDTELRSEARESSAERLFVQITQAGDKDLLGTTCACTMLNASAHGITFVTEAFVPVGSLIDLWVNDKTRPGKFFLSGDVRWTQKIDETSTIIGVRLQGGLATDIESWKEIHPVS